MRAPRAVRRRLRNHLHWSRSDALGKTRLALCVGAKSMTPALISAYTAYSSPSAQYIETSCVADISTDGLMRRLYSAAFQKIEGAQQFKKWQ